MGQRLVDETNSLLDVEIQRLRLSSDRSLSLSQKLAQSELNLAAKSETDALRERAELEGRRITSDFFSNIEKENQRDIYEYQQQERVSDCEQDAKKLLEDGRGSFGIKDLRCNDVTRDGSCKCSDNSEGGKNYNSITDSCKNDRVCGVTTNKHNREQNNSILFRMKINLGNGVFDVIDVKMGDSPQMLANTFSKKHNLSEDLTVLLARNIETKLTQKIYEREKKRISRNNSRYKTAIQNDSSNNPRRCLSAGSYDPRISKGSDFKRTFSIIRKPIVSSLYMQSSYEKAKKMREAKKEPRNDLIYVDGVVYATPKYEVETPVSYRSKSERERSMSSRKDDKMARVVDRLLAFNHQIQRDKEFLQEVEEESNKRMMRSIPKIDSNSKKMCTSTPADGNFRDYWDYIYNRDMKLKKMTEKKMEEQRRKQFEEKYNTQKRVPIINKTSRIIAKRREITNVVERLLAREKMNQVNCRNNIENNRIAEKQINRNKTPKKKKDNPIPAVYEALYKDAAMRDYQKNINELTYPIDRNVFTFTPEVHEYHPRRVSNRESNSPNPGRNYNNQLRNSNNLRNESKYKNIFNDHTPRNTRFISEDENNFTESLNPLHNLGINKRIQSLFERQQIANIRKTLQTIEENKGLSNTEENDSIYRETPGENNNINKGKMFMSDIRIYTPRIGTNGHLSSRQHQNPKTLKQKNDNDNPFTTSVNENNYKIKRRLIPQEGFLTPVFPISSKTSERKNFNLTSTNIDGEISRTPGYDSTISRSIFHVKYDNNTDSKDKIIIDNNKQHLGTSDRYFSTSKKGLPSNTDANIMQESDGNKNNFKISDLDNAFDVLKEHQSNAINPVVVNVSLINDTNLRNTIIKVLSRNLRRLTHDEFVQLMLEELGDDNMNKQSGK